MAGEGAAASELRAGCLGVAPLTARLEPWQRELCARPEVLARWLEAHCSPLNLIDVAPMGRNAAELHAAAAPFDLDLRLFFARKANKCLALVDEAGRLGLGVDVASRRELEQALHRGVAPADVVVTAAVKPVELRALCVESGATVVVDNEDELERLAGLAGESGRRVPVALRLAPLLAGPRSQTRFGLGPEQALAAVARHCEGGSEPRMDVVGVHFHLDGYDAADRVTAIGQGLELVDALRERGHEPAFLDIGGGIPMSYLDSEAEWLRFWEEHREGLLGGREPLTFEGHGLGLLAHEGAIVGRANVYPYHQPLTRGPWFERVLSGEVAVAGRRVPVAQALREHGLQLRCEPGRSLLDGCGLTVARVEFRKQRADGTWLIGVAMNRTQCRSTSDDFLVDPLLLRPQTAGGPPIAAGTGAVDEGFLVGAYCIERELLTWRRMRFPRGVEVGDVVVFPNTAGYLMHILESSSHQIPLARNLVVGPELDPHPDPIDELHA